MTYEVVAVVTPDPAKIDQVREGLEAYAKSVQENEPDVLRYQVYERINSDGGPEFFVFEEYKDEAANKAHLSTDTFKALAEQIKAESLLIKPLDIKAGKRITGFWSR